MNNESYDRIDRYLLNRMSEEEVIDFKQELELDDILASDVAVRKAIHIELNAVYKDELKISLVEHDLSIDSKQWITPLLRSAGIILLLVASVIVINRNTKDDQFANYDIYEEGIPNYMNEVSKNQAFQMTMNEFKQENYSLAVLGFSNLIEQGFKSDTLQYFLAVSQQRDGDLNSALPNFQEIDNTSVYYQKAEFRIPIIEYQLGQEKQAIEKIRQIASDPFHPYVDLASAFLQKEKVEE